MSTPCNPNSSQGKNELFYSTAWRVQQWTGLPKFKPWPWINCCGIVPPNYRNNNKAWRMAQWVQVPATKSDEPGSIPKTHPAEDGSPTYTYTLWYMHTFPHTCTYKINTKNVFWRLITVLKMNRLVRIKEYLGKSFKMDLKQKYIINNH